MKSLKHLPWNTHQQIVTGVMYSYVVFIIFLMLLPFFFIKTQMEFMTLLSTSLSGILIIVNLLGLVFKDLSFVYQHMAERTTNIWMYQMGFSRALNHKDLSAFFKDRRMDHTATENEQEIEKLKNFIIQQVGHRDDNILLWGDFYSFTIRKNKKTNIKKENKKKTEEVDLSHEDLLRLQQTFQLLRGGKK